MAHVCRVDGPNIWREQLEIKNNPCEAKSIAPQGRELAGVHIILTSAPFFSGNREQRIQGPSPQLDPDPKHGAHYPLMTHPLAPSLQGRGTWHLPT